MSLLRPLEELAEKWTKTVSHIKNRNALDRYDHGARDTYSLCAVDLERILRESGLEELLEAGQTMRETFRKSTYESRVEALKAYDAALEKVKGKSA